MENWLKVCILLCIFGFIKEIRPSEPFIYEYLTGPWWNNTEETVLQKIYPIGTYSYLAELVIVFLITDLCRYKPLIVVLGLSGVMVWSMLAWSSTLVELQILEVAYGMYYAAAVAYFTYIYAKVPKEHYAKVTSYTRAAILAGTCFSSSLSQILVLYEVMDYKQLNYISVSAQITATIWSLFLPSVQTSIYFHKSLDKQTKSKSKYKDAFVLMKTHFTESFSNMYVIKWSIWWALATCGLIQVQAYMQPLWTEINKSQKQTLHNGTVEAVATIVGCFGTLAVGYLKVNWKRMGELILSVCCVLSGILLIISSQTDYILVSYSCYVAYAGMYYFVITIATSEVAKNILEDSYGLVFGFNTFIALTLQTLGMLTLVTGDLGWALLPRDQHMAYGIYHLGIAVIFMTIGIIQCIKNSNKQKLNYIHD